MDALLEAESERRKLMKESGIDESTKDPKEPGNDICEELEKLNISMQSSEFGLSHSDERKRQKLLRTIKRSFVLSADVVCCTCSNATPQKLFNQTFDTVLIDESTQAKDVECLVPIVNGCKKLILIGDHCQLGPIVLSKQAENAGLGQSLFERLLILCNSSS